MGVKSTFNSLPSLLANLDWIMWFVTNSFKFKKFKQKITILHIILEQSSIDTCHVYLHTLLLSNQILAHVYLSSQCTYLLLDVIGVFAVVDSWLVLCLLRRKIIIFIFSLLIIIWAISKYFQVYIVWFTILSVCMWSLVCAKQKLLVDFWF